jgi:hypothetical protein
MQVDGRLPIGQQLGDISIHILTANVGRVGSIVTALFIYFFEGRMFSCWIVMDVTSTRGTFHCCKTHIPCGDQLMICGL